MQKYINDNFGITVNIGIAENRLCAKMASDFEKPNKIHTLFRHEVVKKMWPLKVDDLFMIGRKSAVILHQLGIHTIGDLIDAMVWRTRNTSIGDAFNTPLFNLLAAIFLTIGFIVMAVALFVKWILKCFHLTEHVKKVGKFFNKLWNKFKSITIFK